MTSDKTSQMETVLTPDEVARGMKLSLKTVLRLLREGRLRGVKAGGQWRISISEYNRFISEGVWREVEKPLQNGEVDKEVAA